MAGAPVCAPGSPVSASGTVPSRVPTAIAVSAAAREQLRGAGAARLQHEDRASEAEQADAQVAPQPELVEQAQRLRNRLGQRARHLGAAVAWDGDEGVFGVLGGGRRHGSLPTPELPGQVQTVGDARSHPLSPVSPSSRTCSVHPDITSCPFRALKSSQLTGSADWRAGLSGTRASSLSRIVQFGLDPAAQYLGHGDERGAVVRRGLQHPMQLRTFASGSRSCAQWPCVRPWRKPAEPAAYGASGPDTTGTHTFFPIASSCRTAEHQSAKPRQDNHDYVEHAAAVTDAEQGKHGRPGVGST